MEGKVSYSPVLRVRRFIDKMKSERSSPRLSVKRYPTRTISEEAKLDGPDYSPIHLRKVSKRNMNVYNGENQFTKIPDEATMFIFSFLEVEDLVRVRAVSKEFCSLADDDLIWKSICTYDWDVKCKVAPTWKESYQKLDVLYSEGIWEGMSKWVEPVGYGNEQKTTARLHFMKRIRPSQLQSIVAKASPTVIHRVDSQANNVASPAVAHNAPSKNYKESLYRIQGGGVTINCSSPSPFKIEGERSASDNNGCTFTWNKHFEKHVSVYNGTLDYSTGIVEGTIEYNDGNTLWKGVFRYSKVPQKANKNKAA